MNQLKARSKRLLGFASAFVVSMAPASLLVAATPGHASNIFTSLDSPAVSDQNDPNSVELGIKFTSDVNGNVTGIRFYKGGTDNGGVHYGHLWTASGSLLAQAQFTSETGSGWQAVTFSSPVAITAGTTYIASYYAPQGHYSATSGGLTSAVDHPPLHALADSVSSNGVFLYTGSATGSFPTDSYLASNYWVDIDFVAGGDTTAPTVSIATPSADSQVSGTVALTANASDDVAVATVQYSLDGNALGSALTGSPYAFNWDTTSVANGQHTLTATATDTSGNVGTASVSVTVQNSAATSSTLFQSLTPAHPVSDDGSSVNLGVKFQSSQAGYVTGMRFYKGDATNGGTHLGQLWSSSGTLLAQATFTNESASGWQEVAFSPSVSVTAGTTYVVSYFAPQGHYAYDASGDAYGLDNAISNPPLTALSSASSGGNGVFLYGSSAAFPTDTFNSTNYWVDVDLVVDTTAPTVSIATPSAGAQVAGTVTLTANASDDVAVSSVQYLLDGNALSTALSASPYAYSFDTTQVADGAHTLTARAIDPSGNVGTASISITVQNAVSPPTTILQFHTPIHGDSGDGAGITLGVKFQASVDGYVTGLRFYKGGSGNGGTHIGQLWSSNGALLAQATFINETASGWQSVAFPSGVAVTAGTTYVASYFAPEGHYSYDSGSDPNGLVNAISNPPLTALSSASSGGNCVYVYGSSAAFPTATFNSNNYWVDAYFSTTNTAPDTTPPTASIANPANGATVSGTVTVTASASDNVAVSSVQYYLDSNALGGPVATSPYASNWDTTTVSNGSHTLTAVATDSNGNTATSQAISVTVQNIVPPRAGVRGSGPVLVLTDPSNAFSDAYCDSLFKTEGLPECAATDTGNLTSAFDLTPYRAILLAQGQALTAAQVTLVTNWVTAGGTFIAMRPDNNLASLLGIGDSLGTVSDQYYKVDSAVLPGIETQSMQFHGAADEHALNTAQAMATLYSDATTATSFPAITTNTVGSGKAIAYVFDVSKSVLLTRNGNPALAGQVTVSGGFDNNPRFVDRFANGWLDTSKVAIPQADELQRSLANLIVNATAAPRFWYFPTYKDQTIKAALILTGDDHNSGQSTTLSRFAAEQTASDPGCSPADWTCYTSTSYAYPNAFSDSQAKPYTDAQFEVSLHADDNGSCLSNWSTEAQLDSIVSNDFVKWQAAFPSISAASPPLTERFHCYGIWRDYASIPVDEASHGIKADNNSPCWPNSFLNVGQCLFTGAGMPQAYADQFGKLIGVYQFTTQATDENSSTVTQAAINGLVTNATGPNAYYGYFTILCHLDNLDISNQCAISTLNVAQTNNIPMISAELAAKFWDGRNNSSVSGLSYGANTVSFTVNAQANHMQVMVPVAYNGKALTGVTAGGTAATYTTQTINGIQYGFVTVASGNSSLVATYQ